MLLVASTTRQRRAKSEGNKAEKGKKRRHAFCLPSTVYSDASNVSRNAQWNLWMSNRAGQNKEQ